jgi:RNA polymerase sigma factor (sigma-70 family)
MTAQNRLITRGSKLRLRLAADDRLVAFVRRGDSAAFEVLYERHSRGVLSFCIYMLGSKHDAEDAVQATFASAYRALRADGRPVALRPWLFTIARNDCLSILRKRHPTVELNGEPALGGDPVKELEVREEVRHMLDGLRELPEKQRAALVLAELQGLSQQEIAGVLGVEPEQVKAFVYQARSNLISNRRAREADCREIREELATARGAALLRSRLRRHLRSCAECRGYADGVARQRGQLAALLPFAPSLALKYRVLEEALGIGGVDPATYAGGATVAGSVAGTAAEIAGGGVKALALKVATGAALVGASAGVGASVIGTPVGPIEHAPAVSVSAERAARSLVASVDQPTSDAGSLSDSVPGAGSLVNGVTGEAHAPTSLDEHGTVSAGLETDTGSPDQTGTAPSDDSNQGDSALGQKPAPGAPPTAGDESHQKRIEEQEQRSQQRTQEAAEDERQNAERKQQHEQGQLKREEEKRLRQEEQRVGRSRPPKSEEVGEKEPEEPPPVGHSRAPKSEEQLRKQRERRERRRKEREEQKEAGGETPSS